MAVAACIPATAAPCPMARVVATTPFSRAQDAWFWTMAALVARREGARGSGSAVPRPCEPDDVVKCLDRLYQRGRIGPRHARVLRRWGERQIAPRSDHPAEQADSALWQEALDQLAWPLRLKGIVA